MRNICLHIAYDGTDFCGWQRQDGKPTVQGCLEKVLESILGTKAAVAGSGRTDAGVHATDQVANFKTHCRVPSANLRRALNNLLPPAVRVTTLEDAPPHFHARYSVRAKVYRYRILQAPVCPPFLARFVYHVPYPLDRRRMAQAARCFHGEHDFTSFAAATGSNKLPQPGGKAATRRIFRSRVLWRPRTSMLVYEITGSGFLRHMVRNIVGTLIEVGRGRILPEEVPGILGARDRSRAGPTAPAKGLCLVKVEYGRPDLQLERG